MILLVALVGIGVGIGIALVVTGLFSTTAPAKRMAFTKQIDTVTRQSALFALVGGGLVGLLTWWPVGVLIGAGVGWTLRSSLTQNSSSKVTKRLDALATWIETLRDSVASHRGLVAAIESTVSAAPKTLRPNIEALVVRIRSGIPVDRAFEQLAAELGDSAADEAIAPLILAARFGGTDLANLLGQAATNTRTHLALWQRTELARSKPRREMRIVLMVTLGFIGLAFTAGHSYMAAFGTFDGQIALLLIAGLFASGFAMMNRLSKPQQMPRLFSSKVTP